MESEAVDTLVEEEETEAHETTQEPEPGKPRPHAVRFINSLPPWEFQGNFICVLFKLILVLDG